MAKTEVKLEEIGQMKKVVTVTEVDGEGLMAFLGKRVTLFTERFIYTGDLTGVNESCVLLENGGVVYDTGDFSNPKWADYQKLPGSWYVQIAKIESFGLLK
jgi:hypothetical protein